MIHFKNSKKIIKVIPLSRIRAIVIKYPDVDVSPFWNERKENGMFCLMKSLILKKLFGIFNHNDKDLILKNQILLVPLRYICICK